MATPQSSKPAPPPAPRFQVFGGYSLLHEAKGNMNAANIDLDLNLYPNTLIPQTNFEGWNAEGQYNLSRWLGGVVDASGFSGYPFTGANGLSGVPKLSSYSILAGPVISYRRYSRATPFVHALFGWNRANLAAGSLRNVPFPVSSAGVTFTDFTMAFGGGVDYRVTHHISLRLGQLDWFRTSINLNSFYGTAFSNTFVQGFETKEKNLRVSGGMVVGF